MSDKEIICPVCSSTKITRFEKDNFDQLALGDRFLFKEIYYKCHSCNEEGDFFGETDPNYLIAQKEAQFKLIKQVIENLADIGISMALFERAFELPTRTLTRWKTGDFSSSAIALLRIAITYPWIIEIAEKKFDSDVARISLIKAADKAIYAIHSETTCSSTYSEVKTNQANVPPRITYNAITGG